MAELPAGMKSVQESISRSLGDEVKGVTAYGRALRKLLVLVDTVSAEILGKAADAVVKARKEGMFVLIATRHDIQTSADVFPVRYLEMKKTHHHLDGDNALADLEIHDTHMRLRVEQELKSSMFRLRQCYITATIAPQRAVMELGDILRNTIPAFEVLKERCPAASDLDGAPLMRDKRPAESELKDAISQIHDLVGRASAIADEWNQ